MSEDSGQASHQPTFWERVKRWFGGGDPEPPAEERQQRTEPAESTPAKSEPAEQPSTQTEVTEPEPAEPESDPTPPEAAEDREGEAAPSGTSATYVGLDLAWSDKNPSGLAVLDESGALLDSGTAKSDDDIAQWLATRSEHPSVVAIDAPLVVPNEKGRRRAEAEISAAYAKYHAGTFPANRSNPLFDPPRGQVLSERLGWQITSEIPGEGEGVSIEVYPHPAMIALFGLDQVLPYKARQGRSVEFRLDALGDLMDHLESLTTLQLDASDRWRQLRIDHRKATRPVQLKALEDELDAIFCGYLAWLWGTNPAAMTVWGSDEEGFIISPTSTDVPGPA